MYLEGLRHDPPSQTLFNDMTGPFCDAIEAGYRPPAEILALSSPATRTFTSGCGDRPRMDRTLYAESDFAVGSAGTNYCPQDRQIGITFGTRKTLPVISVFIDPFDNPDGSVKVRGKDGHAKARHLPAYSSIAQDRGAVLALYDLAPGLDGSERNSIGMNVMLPAKADGLWIDGHKVETGGKLDQPCSASTVAVVREGKGAVAARVFGVEGLEGFTPQYAIKNDTAGGAVARLVAYAYRGETRPLPARHVHAAVLLVARSCPTDEDFSHFLDEAKHLDVTLTSTAEGWLASTATLQVGLDAKGHVTARKVNGADVKITGPALLNGRDLGALLTASPSQLP